MKVPNPSIVVAVKPDVEVTIESNIDAGGRSSEWTRPRQPATGRLTRSPTTGAGESQESHFIYSPNSCWNALS
jgi:hypothetical protein